jgi:hypothetical protein
VPLATEKNTFKQNNRCFSTPHKRSKKKPEAFVCVVVGVVFLIGGVLVVVALHLLPLV